MDETVAAWLSGAMERRGLSNRMLAQRAGLNHSAVSRIRRGISDPSWATVSRLSRALGEVPPVVTPPQPPAHPMTDLARALRRCQLKPSQVEQVMNLIRYFRQEDVA